MEYSAGMVSQVFALAEMRKTAELLGQGMSKDEVWEKIQSENLYQLKNSTRLRRTFRYVCNRLEALPDDAVKMLPAMDADNAKIVVLISIMKTDLLFFEFVYEVYRGKKILGEKALAGRDINGFFDDKANQSDIVRRWSEAGIQKLKGCYVKNLVDAGLLENSKNKVIKPVLIDYRIEELFRGNGMDIYIHAMKGI